HERGVANAHRIPAENLDRDRAFAFPVAHHLDAPPAAARHAFDGDELGDDEPHRSRIQLLDEPPERTARHAAHGRQNEPRINGNVAYAIRGKHQTNCSGKSKNLKAEAASLAQTRRNGKSRQSSKLKSRHSRTFFERSSMVNGFCMKSTPGCSSTCCTVSAGLYP